MPLNVNDHMPSLSLSLQQKRVVSLGCEKFEVYMRESSVPSAEVFELFKQIA